MQPFHSFTVYSGDGDYVFYRRNLVRKDMRWLMLVMERPGYEYRYVWRFTDRTGRETAGRDASRSIVSNRLSI